MQYDIKKLSLNEKILFFEQFKTYISSSIPLSTTLQNIKKFTSNSKIENISQLLLKEIDKGVNFSDAILKFKQTLGAVYCNLMSLGAQSGELPKVLDDIQAALRQQRTINYMILKQIAYPAFLFFVLFIPAVCALFFFVIPRLSTSFETLLGSTPAHLQTLNTLSTALIKNIIPLLILLGAVIAGIIPGIKILLKSELLIQLPLIGPLVRYYNLSLFTKLLAISYKAGIPITHGVLISCDALPNKIIQTKLIKCSTLVTKIPLTNAIAQTNLFDPQMISKIQAGEITGELDKTLYEISKDIDEALETTISTVLKLIEPVLMIIMAILVCVYGSVMAGIII